MLADGESKRRSPETRRVHHPSTAQYRCLYVRYCSSSQELQVSINLQQIIFAYILLVHACGPLLLTVTNILAATQQMFCLME